MKTSYTYGEEFYAEVYKHIGDTTVEIPLEINKLGFYNRRLEYIVESGEFEIMVGTSSESYLKDSIFVK